MSDLGSDIGGASDLDPLFGVVDGRRALAEAAVRRLSTPRGELALIGDSREYGYDVRAQLNDDVGPRALFEIEANVSREVLKDERVESATAKATLAAGRLTIALDLADAAGPFKMTLAVSAVTVELLKVQ